MSGYFLGLIVVSFVSAAVMTLAPRGMIKSYVRLLCGFCVIICIVIPIFSFVGDGEELSNSILEAFNASTTENENSVEIYNNSLNIAAINNAEENLKSAVIKGVGARYEDFDININIEEKSDGFYINDIIVTFYISGYSIDPKKVENICSFYFEAPIEFVYK